MAQKLINLEVVTPERVVSRQVVRQITLPTTSGEITVLPDHIPLISVLKPGVIEYKNEDGSQDVMSVSGGFIEVMRDKIVILADTAEKADELDEERIKVALEKAEKLKSEAQSIDHVEFTAATIMMEKELARGRALRRWRRVKGLDRG